MVERLAPFAAAQGRSLGVKFSNTLVVENNRGFFPASEPVMYLSGPPLHPLAIALVARFRSVFGDRLPVSFSGGVDERNFPDAVGLGLKPVTVCSDLLQSGGYRRGWRYFGELVKRMDAVGAKDLEVFTLKAHGQAEAALAGLGLAADRAAQCHAALGPGCDPRAAAGDAFAAWVSAARVLNSAVYAKRVLADRRYSAAENATPPKKVGSALVLFDCMSCDKCIPVCPNDANFSFSLPIGETAVERLTPMDGGFAVEVIGSVRVAKPHQIGAFADVCNECGHCDVLCPEDGGPYKTKPLFFGSLAAFEAAPHRDGFFVERSEDGAVMHGRFAGDVVRIERAAGRTRYTRSRLRPHARSGRCGRQRQRRGRRPGRPDAVAHHAADPRRRGRPKRDQLRQRVAEARRVLAGSLDPKRQMRGCGATRSRFRRPRGAYSIATRYAACVFAAISSSVTPGAISISAMPR